MLQVKMALSSMCCGCLTSRQWSNWLYLHCCSKETMIIVWCIPQRYWAAALHLGQIITTGEKPFNEGADSVITLSSSMVNWDLTIPFMEPARWNFKCDHLHQRYGSSIATARALQSPSHSQLHSCPGRDWHSLSGGRGRYTKWPLHPDKISVGSAPRNHRRWERGCKIRFQLWAK